MQIIHSKQHRGIVGSVNDAPYAISFDADGFAEVEDAVAEQLTSGSYGVALIDEDGAEIGFAEKVEKDRMAAEKAKADADKKTGKKAESKGADNR